jgi:capsular exopolysaccharide synthesis family protein
LVDIHELLRLARRYRRLLVAVPVALGLLGFLLSSLQQKSYSATASVLVGVADPSEQVPGGNQSQTRPAELASAQVQTQVGVITSRDVLEAAAKDLPDLDIKKIKKMVTARQRGSTTLVEVTAVANQPEQAQRVVNSVVTAYTANRKASAAGGLEQALSEVNTKLTELSGKLDKLNAGESVNVANAAAVKRAEAQVTFLQSKRDQLDIDIKVGRGGNDTKIELAAVTVQLKEATDLLDELNKKSATSAANAAELKAAQTQYADLFSRQQQLEIAINLKKGGTEVVSAADLPTDPISPSPVRDAITAAFLGLILAAVIAFLRDRLDTSVRGADGVAALTSSPILAQVPDDPAVAGKATLAFLDAPFSAFSEAIRGLRTSIQFLNMATPVEVIVVTGTSPGEGKTTISVNTALAHVQVGKRVLLVSADLRRPRLDEFFGEGRDSHGLSDIVMDVHNALASGQNVRDVLTDDLRFTLADTGIDGLSFLPCGTIPPNPNELLGSEAMQRLVIDARRHFDLVVIDTSPVSLVSDALVTARFADGIVLVVEPTKISRAQLSGVYERIQSAGLRLLGTVVNRTVDSNATYGYGSYTMDGEPPATPAPRGLRRKSEIAASPNPRQSQLPAARTALFDRTEVADEVIDVAASDIDSAVVESHGAESQVVESRFVDRTVDYEAADDANVSRIDKLVRVADIDDDDQELDEELDEELDDDQAVNADVIAERSTVAITSRTTGPSRNNGSNGQSRNRNSNRNRNGR